MTFAKQLARLAAVTAIGGTAFLMHVDAASAETTMRVVMHSDLKIVDPIWTTAYIARNAGYMIYDTLLAMNGKQEPQPQMAERYEVSEDNLVYTFTLRDGLKWHDGTPVTSEDCIASIKRWGARDAMGQKMMASVAKMEAVDQKTFKIFMKEPYGLVILSLAKPSSNVPFMMPKRVAETSPNEQISDFTGSGPFVFKRDEWKPGEKTVFVKFADYKPRKEKPSWMSGGKVVNVDRVEWVAISDSQTAVNALLAGEIDMIEDPALDLLPVLKADKNVGFDNINVLGNQYVFRFNSTQPPFNNPKIREAAFAAFNQQDFLQAVIGNPDYYKVCPDLFICGTPYATDEGTKPFFHSDFALSKKLLQEAGYDGTPVVLLHSTDLQVLTNLAPVAKSLLEKGGFKVQMLDMDWQSVVARRAKKDPPTQGGWSAFMTSWASVDVLNPVAAAFLAANCDKAAVGWPCDEEMEKLRDQYAHARDADSQKEIAKKVQLRALEIGTHVWLGQWNKPIVYRKDKVDGWLEAPLPLFWNVTKKGA
ncbi:MAG TPA: ABC transporter substrate-binding protein [Candidatus Cybelea sp.]|nr:ABC transporter substrate-binding protein [Candidatus Cybelea sp.]